MVANEVPPSFMSCHVLCRAGVRYKETIHSRYVLSFVASAESVRDGDMFKGQRALLVSSVASNPKMKSQEVSMMLTWIFSSNLVSGGMTWFLEGTVESTQSTNPQRV